MMSENPHAGKPIMPGIGMPVALYLQEFGSKVWSAFGCPPYQVGSSMYGKTWRDVDVRLILGDEEYEALGLGDPGYPHNNAKWVSLCMAYSALGTKMTGLPIDFQIQQQTRANMEYPHGCARGVLGLIPSRFRKEA